jgi:hypothetical protein
MEKPMSSKSELIAADVAALLRARNPLLWVITREETRAEGFLFEAAAAAGYVARTWDVAQGIANISGKVENAEAKGPDVALDEIASRATGNTRADRCVWIMRDLGPWLSGPGGAVAQRQLRNLARMLPGTPPDRAQAIIVLSAGGEIPPELAAHATVIDWPLPDRAEIADILDATVQLLPEDIRKTAVNGKRDAAIDAAVGLSGEEAQACYAKSLVQFRCVDPGAVAQEKKRAIARERVLEWFDPLPGGLDWVGGLDNLKSWLKARASAYSIQAREYGLPAPRGVVIVGVSGCGKSLLAKAISATWQVPLIRLDLNALKGKYVGQSEANIRKAFAQIEALGRCVVWIDEIEKALAGATSGSADGGVSADALGSLLSWMQERQGEAFIIATANDVSQLPPEMIRKGRWDEIWFVDLPNDVERVSVLQAALRQYKRNPKAIDVNLQMVADATEGFTGAEIAALIPDAMFTAFNDKGRQIGTVDLLNAAKTVVPLSRTADKKISDLRAWAQGRARPASETLTVVPKTARVLDIA